MLNVSIVICRRDPRLDAEGALRKARKTNAVMINIQSISSGPREIGKVAMFLQTTIIHSANAAWLTGLYFGDREALGSTNDSIQWRTKLNLSVMKMFRRWKKSNARLFRRVSFVFRWN